ncbi:hypothetical protein SGO26_11020 [Cupriavidus metallidurans]|uniref:hypothetical protein n=1 Tax=Cupriavidus TaxID=106589 RepID=UPI0002A1B558|nr:MULTISPECIES: hypothetical protein [Cupriavidus]ELA00636.1 hypothetical protein D769_04379 [Cupriavidus sp. HMR-1]GMG90639.1 hypothetical protein Cmtc_18590 [Cupriavidus sp. TKC]HBD35017.1 hypothetical protein [Cupriavidus sp.]HBO79074.1 hypothetical protein [Cupriavidus sp.]
MGALLIMLGYYAAAYGCVWLIGRICPPLGNLVVRFRYLVGLAVLVYWFHSLSGWQGKGVPSTLFFLAIMLCLLPKSLRFGKGGRASE